MQSNNMCDYCKKRDDRPFCYDTCDVAFSDKNKTIGELNCEFEGIEVMVIDKKLNAKWIARNSRPMTWECTNCGGRTLLFDKPYKYCPHCSAKMDGDE